MTRNALLLGVNIDHTATLRQARYRDLEKTCGGVVEPDPVYLALLAEEAGADGITVHLREDRRHIQEEDVRRLRKSLRTRLNLEMSCTPAMVEFALDLSPEAACLVPEGRDEVTTEGGLEVAGDRKRVEETVQPLREAGIEVSLFIDPEPDQIQAAAELGAPVIELHTGTFANARGAQKESEVRRLQKACIQADRLGLVVNAGHGINYQNIADILRLPYLHELNIGHSIISRAVSAGLREAVREMKARLEGYDARKVLDQ
ncbi:MAG: pyridoxine 5'-phosphate synthase [Opitutales bacterium]|nr:pyridoxine 5'-phosphate synthase [Opitutales bacterium]MCH8540788.1 pyridoxine 5'-phosphate synthase [Opitutales bacterium]